jgi:hypothetical protein
MMDEILFLTFFKFPEELSIPMQVVPSIHDGSMECKNLNSTWKSILDFQEFILLVGRALNQ